MRLMKFAAFGVVALAALATLAACREGLGGSIWAVRFPDRVEGAINLPDGVFPGVGAGGFGGSVYVDVTIEGNAIVGIDVTAHGETPAFAASVFDHLIPMILAVQSADVDAVAGATETSRAFIAAVADAIGLPDGVFPGIGAGGFGGDIFVNVAIEGNEIVGIEVTAHNETPAFAASVFSHLAPTIIAVQSVNVDIVAGATDTSSGFIAAVSDALMRAATGGASPGAPAPPAPTPVAVAPQAPEPTPEPVATPQAPEPAAQPDSEPAAPAPAAVAAAPAAPEPAPAPATRFTAGIYNAFAFGYYGDIHVAVTFAADAIEAIAVTSHEETPMFANMAFGIMIPAMLAAQSYDVDIVASATYTSEALREAVRLAIEQASN